MRGTLLLPMFLIPLTACFVSNAISQTIQVNKNISEGIVLDKTRLEILPCLGYSQKPTRPDSSIIKVETKTLVKKDLKYEYLVSGGSINGKGKKVAWDLSKLLPGSYTLTVAVHGKNNFHKIFTTKIDVPGCYITNCLICPTTSIRQSAESIKAGDAITLTADVRSVNDSEIYFEWKVSGGKIIKGQGTPLIVVKVHKSQEKYLTVELKVGGVCPICTEDTTKQTIQINYAK